MDIRTFISGEHPIYEFIFPEKLTEEHYNTFLEKFDECFQKKELFNVLFNFSKASSIPMKVVYKSATDLNERELETEKYLLKSSIYISGSMMRKVLKIFFKLRKPIRPNLVAENYREAYKYLSTTSN